MEELKLKYEHAQKAIKSIKAALERAKKSFEDELAKEMAQESIIKRFEYSIDTLWKYLKLYLLIKHGVEQKSPKQVFKECFRVGLITEDQTTQALEMIDDRNLTSHTYNEAIAEEIATTIPSHFELMNHIIESITPE